MSAAYLGTLGRLVGFENATAVSISTSRPVSFSRTLEGRVKAQYGPTTRRSWNVEVRQAKPEQVANLLGLLEGGTPPFVWVEPYAQVTNLLGPGVSTCDAEAAYSSATSQGGPMLLGDGQSSVRSLLSSSLTTSSYVGNVRTPVLPGQPVTASMWVLGAGAKVRLHWIAADGTQVGMGTSAGTGSAATPTRLHVTATPPAGAVSCIISTLAATQAANPAITWTKDLAPWSLGRGCHKSVVSGFDETVHMASADIPGWRRSTISFTITEVG